MQLQRLLTCQAALAVPELDAVSVFRSLPLDAPLDWRAVAAALAVWLRRKQSNQQGPLVFGLAGGQGAGKSTLSRLLVAALEHQGLRAATLSLDDVYHTKATRAALAEEVHPLLATRGVPGTHDLALLVRTLDRLGDATIELPAFDKGLDDRLPQGAWTRCAGPLDVLVFEGWCLGVTPELPDALGAPVNTLEAQEDAAGRYRRFVNTAIAEAYVPLWERLDAWLFLAVPSFAAVRRWRSQQERALPVDRRMGAVALERFCAHYERLTNHLLRTASHSATWQLSLREDHSVEFRVDSAGGS